MPADKRHRLTAAALELSHRVGLSNASLATIAEHADVPVGNVYYYFKTKDDLAQAVIDARRTQHADLRRDWEAATDDPVERLVAFVRHTRDTAEDLTAYGCPIGGLCQDLAHTNEVLGTLAGRIFADTIEWVAAQLELAGRADPGSNARRVVALLQGVTVLAHATQDAELLRDECRRLEHDLRHGLDVAALDLGADRATVR